MQCFLGVQVWNLVKSVIRHYNIFIYTVTKVMYNLMYNGGYDTPIEPCHVKLLIQLNLKGIIVLFYYWLLSLSIDHNRRNAHCIIIFIIYTYLPSYSPNSSSIKTKSSPRLPTLSHFLTPKSSLYTCAFSRSLYDLSIT